MLLDQDVKFIGKISLLKIEHAKNVALETDWHDHKFDRNEETLKEGRLCTLPYLMRNEKQKIYSASQDRLISAVMPVVDEVLEYMPTLTPIRGEVVNLLPGKELIPHIDIYWFHKYSRRIHIPLYTNDSCVQIFEDREQHLDIGSAYEINNRIIHSARNSSNQPRIHIIIDLLSQDRLQEVKENRNIALQVIT